VKFRVVELMLCNFDQDRLSSQVEQLPTKVLVEKRHTKFAS